MQTPILDEAERLRVREVRRQLATEALPLVLAAVVLAIVVVFLIAKALAVSTTLAKVVLSVVLIILGVAEVGVVTILALTCFLASVEIKGGSYKVDE